MFFIALFLIYHVGYLGYYWILQKRIDQKWLAQVEYQGLTKKVSVPMSLPYWSDESDYHYTSGKLVWEGKIYRKIKQKYSKGALHIILVEDRMSQELNLTVSKWVKSVTDTQNENSNKTTLISIVKDYIHVPVEFAYEPGFSFLSKKLILYRKSWKSISPEIVTPPPKAV